MVSPEDRFEKIRQEDIEDHYSGLENERGEMPKVKQWNSERMGLIHFQEIKFIY